MSDKENDSAFKNNMSLARESDLRDANKVFSKGAVTRLKVKNFLTYSEMELIPGPNLNMIIGPNGTGKSTIVCALCLGLGGKPSVLGRAGNVEDYIQYEKEKAVIEIDLFYEVGSKISISRTINRSGTSTWMLNNRNSNLKAVESKIKELNIQVTNLCQFLPQDRVADFVKMTPQELLGDTQKAVGSIEMFDQHTELKRQRAEHRELEGSNRSESDRLKQEIEKNEKLENAVKNYFEREKFLDSIDLLKKKKNWIEYSTKREEYNTKKTELASAEKQFKSIREKATPYLQNFKAKESEEKEVQEKILKDIGFVNAILVKLKQSRRMLEDYSAKLSDIGRDLKEKEQDEQQRLEKVAHQERQLQKLEDELASNPENTDNVVEELAVVMKELANLSAEVTQFENEKENMKASSLNLKRQLNSYNEMLKREQDTDKKKLEILQQKNKSVFEATMWLRQNKHMFKHTIHEPVMMSINVVDPRYAKYVEVHIPYRDLMMFVCEDKDDLELFAKTMCDERKLKLNVALAPSIPLDSFRPPAPIEHFSRWGFTHYLKDLVSGPDAVMRYLCRHYALHAVPVGNEVTDNNRDKVGEDTPFRSFYALNYAHRIKTSKYGNRASIRTSSPIPEARLLVISVNQTRIQDYVKTIEQCEEQLKSTNEELVELQSSERAKAKVLEELRERKRNLQRQRDFRRNIIVNIEQKKKTLQTLSLQEIDIVKERQKSGLRIKKANDERFQIMMKYNELLKKYTENCKDNVITGLTLTLIKMKKDAAKVEYEDASRESTRLEDDVNELKERCMALKGEAKRLLDIAKKASGIAANQNLSQAVQNKFGVLPNTLEEIDSQINQEQARVDLMFPVDVNVVKEFEQRKNLIEELQKGSRGVERQLENLASTIEECRNVWEPAIEDLLSRINHNFSHFFSRLQCVGEVSLKRPENPLDFDKYGVCIRVKFRDNEALHELTASHQSGGEKSVSTVLYMMALQELTKVPFRCVDEINQGMDSKNERKVFEFVVETACRTTSSQYFLLTPKLLTNLQYSPQMKVHIIQNGVGVDMKYDAWDVKKFIRRARRQERD